MYSRSAASGKISADLRLARFGTLRAQAAEHNVVRNTGVPGLACHGLVQRSAPGRGCVCETAAPGAYDVMVFVFGAMMLALALMGVDLAVVLLVVFAYLFVVGSGIYYRVKFEKEL